MPYLHSIYVRLESFCSTKFFRNKLFGTNFLRRCSLGQSCLEGTRNNNTVTAKWQRTFWQPMQQRERHLSMFQHGRKAFQITSTLLANYGRHNLWRRSKLLHEIERDDTSCKWQQRVHFYSNQKGRSALFVGRLFMETSPHERIS
jgi:hypothetical protein